jgi:protein-histidine pros-kinase
MKFGTLKTAIAARVRQVLPHLILALGCGIVLTLLVVSVEQRKLALRAVDVARENAQLVRRIDAIQLSLIDAESSVRGYIFARDAVFLDSYYAARKELEEAINEVRLRYPTDPQRQAEVNDLLDQVSAKVEILTHSVETVQRGDQVPVDLRGKQVMDKIRVLLDAMRTRVRGIGEGIVADFLSRYRDAWLATLGLSCLTLILMMMLFSSTQRRLSLQDRLALFLRTETERLETTVEERTAELGELASHLNNVRETEKLALARELHDELGAVLTAAKMESNAILRRAGGSFEADTQERFKRLVGLLDNGIGIKRRIIDDLRPPLLIELGLVAALRSMGEDFAHAQGIKLALDLPEDDPPLPPDSALALFRIAQEALTNIRKYASANKVELSLTEVEDDQLELKIVDDGRGFDPANTPLRSHGLLGMRHRVRMMRGALSLDSAPGAGTRLVVRISRPTIEPEPA